MHEHLHIRGSRKLWDSRIKLGRNDNGSAQIWVALHNCLSRRRVRPIRVVFQAQDDVIWVLHFRTNQVLDHSRLLLHAVELSPRRGRDQPRRIDDRQVWTILIFNLHDDIFRPKRILLF